MLAAIVTVLSCPTCRGRLHEDPGTLRCENGHAYDIARQGYVTLRGPAGPRHTGDDATMVAARHELLGSGRYQGLAARLADFAADTLGEDTPGPERPPRLVVDTGGGTGYYLQRVLERTHGSRPSTSGLVLDASPYALRRAAGAHPDIAAVGCDLWQRWPLQDAVAALVLCVFAPRNGAETQRVLTPGGSLVVVTPGHDHLSELVSSLGLVAVDEEKDERLDRSLAPYLDRHSSAPHEETMRLSRRDVATVVGMGPSARHLDADTLSAAISLLPDPVDVTLSVVLTRWIRP